MIEKRIIGLDDALGALYKGKRWSISFTYDSLVWLEESIIKPTEAELVAKQKEMQEKGIHQSEWDWLEYDYDIVLENSGTIEALHAKVDDLIVSNKIAHTPAQPTDSTEPLAIGANSF
mgnify:CR=1 FL=1